MSDPVLAERTANALIVDAAPAGFGGTGVGFALRLLGRRYGGLWVGGRARLTARSLTFTPNGPNRAVHSGGRLDLDVPLARITSVGVEPGFVTRIVVLGVGTDVLRIRCFRADDFADRIRAAAAGHAPG